MRNPPIKFSLLTILIFGLTACQKLDSLGSLPHPGDIVFTEIMPFDTAEGSNWMELYNTSDTNIQLKQCLISNKTQQVLTIPESLMVEPEHFAVFSSISVGRTALPSSLLQPNFDFHQDDFQLNSDETLSLICDNHLIDQITYDVNSPEYMDITTSWQRHYRPIEPADSINKEWCYTNPLESYEYEPAKFATPGRANSFCSSIAPFIAYNNQAAVVIENIDLEATLRVAEAEMARKSATSELVIWGIRDQVISPEIAKKVSELYFSNIDMLYESTAFTAIDWNHAVWHFAWAISNLYRNGDAEVKTELQLAYEDAQKRPETLDYFKYIAINYIRGESIVMGDIHTPAHEAVQKLIVAPGNPGYINSYEEYLEKRRGPIEAKAINAAYAAGKFLSNIFQ